MGVGEWLAVSGVKRIVSSLGLGQPAVGLTFVALATTADLFALAWAVCRRGIDELVLARVLRSALCNATATFGLAVLVCPIHATGLGWQSWPAGALPASLVAYALMFGRIGRAGEGLLGATYGTYLGLTLR
jgi:cation:H+ antiporter